MLSKAKRLLASLCVLATVLSTSSVTGLTQQNRAAKKGKIQGVVYNVATGSPLTKASIEVVGSRGVVQSGIDGDYTVEVEAGTYSVRFSRDGFVEQTVDNIVVGSGEAKELSAVLTPVGHGETVEVNANTSGDVAAMIEERKSAATISDTISSVEISKDVASSAAGVIQRAPGISVQNRFVYVRGLGERYSNTSLNNAIVPTTEPDRKVVPMDLVPANLLQSVRILKTFTPDQPGEFSGGLVKLDTVELPKSTTLTASFSLGLNTATIGKDFLGYPGGGLRDFFGFGRGSRELPGIIPENRRLLERTIVTPNAFTPEELQAFGRSFENIWNPRRDDARPEMGFSFSGGRSFGKFGLIGALSFKNELQRLEEVRRYYSVGQGGLPALQTDYDYTGAAMVARLGGVLNATYQLSQNNKFFFKNFLTNQATDEARTFEGFNNDRGTDFRNTRLRYVEERIYTGQASGDHLVSFLGDSILTWRLTYARATLDEPDLREALYEFSPVVNDFIYLNQTQSLFRLFNEMRENVREPAADWSKFWFFNGSTFNTKAGFSYVNRDRVFDSRRFRFRRPRLLEGLDLTRSPEALLIPENITPDLFQIQEETRATDHYDALHNVTASYLMGDYTIRKWRFVGGARVEKSEQQVTTFEPFNVNAVPVIADLKDTDVLPSVGISYALKNGSMNLRGGFSKTVARPQFRELAPFEFTDVTGGPSVVGNPELERTLISNYDLRYEWFYGPNELFAISGFYKDLKNPIETVIEATATFRKSFINAKNARNRGLELEWRNNLGRFWDRFENFNFNFNYTFVKSKVDIGDENTAALTNTNRPLVGQAENIANLVLDHHIPRWSFETRALFNYTGERISDVGAFGLPDIIEKGRPNLDLLFARSFGTERKWRAEFTIENILNRRVDFRQGDEIYRQYRRGRTFEVGLSYRFY